MLPQAPGPVFLLPHLRTAAALSAGLALTELPVAIASWRDQIGIEACRFAVIAALITDHGRVVGHFPPCRLRRLKNLRLGLPIHRPG